MKSSLGLSGDSVFIDGNYVKKIASQIKTGSLKI
jgi:hypothetical protein